MEKMEAAVVISAEWTSLGALGLKTEHGLQSKTDLSSNGGSSAHQLCYLGVVIDHLGP